MANDWSDVRKGRENSYFAKKNDEALRRLAEKQAEEKPRISPVSGKPMEQVVINGVVIDKCPESGGIWLDAGELEELISAAKDQEDEKNSMVGFLKDLAGLK